MDESKQLKAFFPRLMNTLHYKLTGNTRLNYFLEGEITFLLEGLDGATITVETASERRGVYKLTIKCKNNHRFITGLFRGILLSFFQLTNNVDHLRKHLDDYYFYIEIRNALVHANDLYSIDFNKLHIFFDFLDRGTIEQTSFTISPDTELIYTSRLPHNDKSLTVWIDNEEDHRVIDKFFQALIKIMNEHEMKNNG